MLEMQVLEQGGQLLHGPIGGHVRGRESEHGFGVFGIARQRLRQVTRQLEVLVMHRLQLSIPSSLGQQHPNGACRDGCQQKEEHWQQLA